MSRTQNSIRNFKFGLGAKILQYTLSFATRTIFISLLSVEYLGVNGLFSSIFSVLSLVEMGSGSVFTSMMFKPIRDKDEKTLCALMKEFDKLYKLFALIAAVIGLAIMPFLNLLVKDTSLPHLHLYYFLFLCGFVVSYLFMPHIQFIIANQKEYIVTLHRNIFVILQYVAQIVLLLVTHNYLLYLIIQISFPVMANFTLKTKALNNYPALKSMPTSVLERNIFSELKTKIRGQFIGRLGFIAANSTRTIIVSASLGLTITGIYSNYYMLILMIDYFIDTIFHATTGSVGDLIAEGNSQQIYLFFRRLVFLSFMVTGFSIICLIVFLNPFINLWIGPDFKLPQSQVVLAVAAYAISYVGFRRPITIFRNTSGLFYNDRYVCLTEGCLVILLSPWMAWHWGLSGIFIAFLLASCTTLLSNIYVLYKHLFKRPILDFFKETYIYFLTIVLLCTLVYFVSIQFPIDSWTGFICMAISCALITLLTLAVSFHRTEEFKYFFKLTVSIKFKSHE